MNFNYYIKNIGIDLVLELEKNLGIYINKNNYKYIIYTELSDEVLKIIKFPKGDYIYFTVIINDYKDTKNIENDVKNFLENKGIKPEFINNITAFGESYYDIKDKDLKKIYNDIVFEIGNKLINKKNKNLKKLILVDRYFQNFKEDHIKFLFDIMDEFSIKELNLIIEKQKNITDEELKDIIKNKLNNFINKEIKINIIKNSLIHDRFWIFPNEKFGFFSGTSLNGYGKRSFLFTSIKAEDYKKIIKEIKELEKKGNKIEIKF